jgi:serine/threonine protein kinase
MARGVGSEVEYYRSKGGVVPVRWTALESMKDNLFSQASDVWAFGVTIFEVFSDGRTPYHECR